MRFCLLGSGSSGNALLLVTAHTKILIDCGLSYRQLQTRAQAVGESLDGLSAVFVTHEHGDHVNGLRVLARNHPVPMFMSHGTAESVAARIAGLDRVEAFEAGDPVAVGDVRVQSFSVTHDAADPVNYVVQNGGHTVGVATDLGHVDDLVRRRLAGCSALVLESNYCPQKLEKSPYPEAIRQRIRSREGHLSNHDTCSLLAAVAHEALRLVVLVHISKENNTADLARSLAQQALGRNPAQLVVAAQDQPTPMFRLDEMALAMQGAM